LFDRAAIALSFIAFLLLFTGVGIYAATRKQNTTADYLLASRSVNFWLTALSTFATAHSGFMFAGMIGYTYLVGISVVWLPIGWIVGDAFTWFFIYKRLRIASEESSSETVGAFLAGNQKSDRAIAIVSALVTLTFLGTYGAGQLVAGSKALHVLFGWDYAWGILLGATIVVFYCFSGGIRASIWTDAAQSLVMMLAMGGLLGISVAACGGLGGLWNQLESIDPTLLDLSPTNLKFGTLAFVLGWLASGLAVLGQPHIIVRAMTQQMELLQSLAQRLERLQQIKEAQRAVSLGPQEEPSAPSVLPVTKIARERQLLAPSDVVPKDDIELKLAKIWERLLGVDRVSPQDNFFQLGGRSLLAVRLFGAIEREFGKKLPPATLFSAPTIAEMADFLRPASPSAPQPTTLDSLVMIRDGGSETPLFLIHDANGETLLYYNLASHLSAERPVYGLRPHSTEKHPIAHANIAEMVAHYIEKIRSVQPHGPYFLGGLCAGGTLACEIAMQLQSAGEEVSLVAIIDAADFNTPVQMQASEERKGRLAAAIQETQNLKPHQRLVSIAKIIARKATNLLIYELVQKNNSPLNNAKFALWRWLVRSNLPLPQFLYNLPFRQVWDLVDPDYVPNSQFEGEVVLFRATSSEVFDDPNIDDTPYIEVYSDPLLGWEKRATEGVVVYDIPGGHSSLLQDRNGRVLAEKLQEYIDRLSRE